MGPAGIPEDKLPPCWSDEVRMNALFAPFRIKAANQESWEMKMKFWSDMLRLWCRSRGDAVLTAADAKVAFQRKGRTPACIDIVVEEMFRSGELVPLSRYQTILQGGSEGWVRWGARIAFKPAALALTAVSSLLPARQTVDSDGLPKASIDATQKFVLEDVLKEQASSFLSSYPIGESRVGSASELMRRAGRTGSDSELIVACLLERGQAVAKGGLLKLADSSGRLSLITETDEALARLLTAETRLETDLTRLARDVATAEGDARAAMALGNKTAAKSHLRRKLTASGRLSRCHQALENVRQLHNQLSEQDQNNTILDTYKTAASAMKRDMQKNNLDEDTVHDTMDDLKEVMDSYTEIERALSGPLEEEVDLEAELKELLATPQDTDNGNTAVKQPPTAPSAAKAPVITPRKMSEREFIFDGEERILAELNELGVDDSSPPRTTRPEKVAEEVDNWTRVPEKGTDANKPWYPPAAEWNNNYPEIRTDERLHPGQALNLDYTSPPHLYAHDFVVQDHIPGGGGVWLYRGGPGGADHFSSESPGKSGSNFQMAPGGERRREALFTDEPSVAGKQPSVASNQPSVATNQPSVASKQPSVASNQPSVASKQPSVATNQPSVASKQPSVASNQPSVASKQPSVASNQPSVASKQPSVASNQPSVASNQPSLAINQPSVASKQSIVASNQPIVAKTEPAVATQPITSDLGDFNDLERRLKNLRGFNL